MTEEAKFVVQVFIAVGTVGAVIVALFKEFLKPRPDLRTKISDDSGYPVDTQSTDSDHDIPTRYFHVKVKNHRRKVIATGVQVYMTNIRKQVANLKYKSIWQGDIPMRWRYQENHPPQRTIGPTIECDVCSVRQGHHVRLMPLISPPELKTEWDPKVNLVLTLQVRSVEIDTDKFHLLISWDGEWPDNEEQISNHIVVKKVKLREDGSIAS